MGYVASVSSTVTAYEPVSTSGEVSFSGLGNGTDFSEIIDAIIDSESYELEDLEEQYDDVETLIDMLEELEDAIDDFNDLCDDLDDPDELATMEATVSSEEVEVDVDGDADVGITTIVVNQLALEDTWVYSGTSYDDEDDVICTEATTLTIELADGTTCDVEISAGSTLENVVDAINNDIDSRDYVEASILDSGNGLYLSLSAVDAGSDNCFTITSVGDIDGWTTDGFEHTQTGQNAQFKINGFPSGDDEWIERDSNTFDDVIDGIEFTLVDVTDEDGVTINVEYDTDGLTETLLDFVDSYNDLIEEIQLLTGRVTEEEEDDDDDDDEVTLDSYAMDIIYSELKSIMASSSLGFSSWDSDTETGDYYTALSQLGFETDTDEGSDTFGLLIYDEDDVEDLVEEDPEAVVEFLSCRATGESDSDYFQVISVIDTVTPAGEHDVTYTVEDGEIVSAYIDGEEADIDGWTILGTGDDSKGIYISCGETEDGTYSGTCRVKQGKIGQLSDALDDITDEEDGTIQILIDNYEDTLTSLDNQIYNEEERLDLLETRLETKYAALDTMLSYYENQSTLLSTLLESASSD